MERGLVSFLLSLQPSSRQRMAEEVGGGQVWNRFFCSLQSLQKKRQLGEHFAIQQL